MALLNYTTTVAVSKTVGEVQKALVAAGARQIGMEYADNGNGNCTALAFVVETMYGPRGFTLPVNALAVQRVLVEQQVERRYREPEHAERVAWRIIKDWIEAQLAIIRTGMVSLDQVMLPYMRQDDGRTMYDLWSEQQLALGPG